MYFYYLTKSSLDQIIQTSFYFILKKEALAKSLFKIVTEAEPVELTDSATDFSDVTKVCTHRVMDVEMHAYYKGRQDRHSAQECYSIFFNTSPIQALLTMKTLVVGNLRLLTQGHDTRLCSFRCIFTQER